MASPPTPLLSYARLFRIPNVFTAFADILLGFFFTHRGFGPVSELLLLCLASGLMYTAGMVLNDVFDVEIDREERPERPLPSGQIPLAFARLLGFAMLLFGCGLAWLVSMFSSDPRPGMVATGLAAMVVGYNAILKKTPLGPLAMGACRGLNVLLGMSALAGSWETSHYLVAGGLAVYITGVTIFAREEAEESSRAGLGLGALVMAAGLGLLAWFPEWHQDYTSSSTKHAPGWNWYVLLGLVSAVLLRRVFAAIFEPHPLRVQSAVKICIFSLVMLDAICCLAVRGPQPAIIILAMLIPTVTLGRWVYST